MIAECPRCARTSPDVDPDNPDLRDNYSGVRVLNRARRREDDEMICLQCGHVFRRDGRREYPHGVEVGRWELLMGEAED